jgi:hypothetical protein
MKKLKFNNLTYVAETPFQWNKGIRIEFEEEIPTELYKYYSSSENNLKAFANNNFFCSHPYHFNDILDSTPLSYDFKTLTFEEYKIIFKDFVEDDKLRSMYENEKMIGFRGYRNFYYSLITQKLGFVCLTKNKMHNLMWGHYASDTGFKIKFNTQILIESLNTTNKQNCLLFPVNYVKYKQHIDTSKYGLNFPLLVDISTKVKDWEYEKEWRIIITKNDMNVPKSLISLEEDYDGTNDRFANYSPKSIEEIVLGFNFFNGKNFTNLVQISIDEITIEAKKAEFSDFLKFICNNMNGNVLKSGLLVDEKEILFEGAKPLKRSLEKLEIKHILDNVFSILRNERDNIIKFDVD